MFCAVIGCNNGRVLGQNECKKRDKGSMLLFKVPKCEYRRKRWMDALLQDLSPGDHVCENHFHDTDIQKENRYLVNGEIPGDIRSLIDDDVVPLREYIPNRDQHTIFLKEMDILRGDSPEPIDSRQDPIAVDNQGEASQTEYCDESNQLQKEKKISHPSDIIQSRLIQTSIAQLGCPMRRTQEGNNIKDSCAPKPDHQLPTLGDMFNYFNSVLREGWCYFYNCTNLILVLMEAENMKEKVRLQINNECIVKVSFCQRKEFYIDRPITSICDLKECMKRLENCNLCNGTGIKDREYAADCVGLIFREFKEQQRFSCSKCHHLRKKLVIRRGYKGWSVEKGNI